MKRKQTTKHQNSIGMDFMCVAVAILVVALIMSPLFYSMNENWEDDDHYQSSNRKNGSY